MPAPQPRAGGHPSGVAVARRRTHRRTVQTEEEGGSERWLVTYGDMLTLLLVLFIVLFSMSVVDGTKFRQLSASLASVFGSGQQGITSGGNSILDNSAIDNGNAAVNPGAPVAPLTGHTSTSTNANEAPPASTPTSTQSTEGLAAQAEQEVENFKQIENAVNKSLEQHGMAGDVQFSMDRRGLVMTVITNALVFPGNSAQLQAEGKRIVAAIAPPLTKITNSIAVNGYTNQVPVSTYPYPTGWELSSARAAAVVRALIGDGITEGRLSATGYNDLDPLLPPTNPRAADRNRRVDIVVMSKLRNLAGDALQQAIDDAGAAGGS